MPNTECLGPKMHKKIGLITEDDSFDCLQYFGREKLSFTPYLIADISNKLKVLNGKR